MTSHDLPGLLDVSKSFLDPFGNDGTDVEIEVTVPSLALTFVLTLTLIFALSLAVTLIFALTLTPALTPTFIQVPVLVKDLDAASTRFIDAAEHVPFEL